MDIHWADHVIAQSVWQDWIGNAISKTINMPSDVTADDVKASYLLAHEVGLKGITVYRDGSRHKQVLHMTSENATKTFEVKPSNYLVSYISDNITNEYVRSQINNALSSVKLEDLPESFDFFSILCLFTQIPNEWFSLYCCGTFAIYQN